MLAALSGASGYVRETDNGTPVSWVLDRTVVMQLSLGGPVSLSDGFQSFNESARDALSIWNTHLPHLQFAWIMSSPVVPTDGDELMSAAFSQSIFGKAWGSGTLAVTMLSYRSGNLEETDTLFNNKDYTWDSYRGALRGPMDFHRVALHEFGHTLGLDHPDQNGQHVTAVMNSRVSNLDTLAQDDIDGVTAIYGNGPAYQTIPDGPVLMNISTRGVTNTGDNVIIGGFVIQGSQPATVIVRGIGPSLASFNVATPLGDTLIQLFDANHNLIASNDDWFVSSNAQTISSYRHDPPASIESALYVTLNPGSYTCVVQSFSSAQQPAQTGVALFELYDLRTSSSRAGNVSTRGQVGTGDNILIAGFIVGSGAAKPVVIRALGPTLTQFGVSGVLADPYLELRDSNGNLVEANDNWQQGPDAGTVQADGKAPSNPSEAAIAPTLSPGSYTALVSGVNNTTGVALVEVYDQS